MPFGGGPRACIGQHFSMVEAVLALALILREHHVTAVTATDQPRVGALITLLPTEPVLARVTRILRLLGLVERHRLCRSAANLGRRRTVCH